MSSEKLSTLNVKTSVKLCTYIILHSDAQTYNWSNKKKNSEEKQFSLLFIYSKLVDQSPPWLSPNIHIHIRIYILCIRLTSQVVAAVCHSLFHWPAVYGSGSKPPYLTFTVTIFLTSIDSGYIANQLNSLSVYVFVYQCVTLCIPV